MFKVYLYGSKEDFENAKVSLERYFHVAASPLKSRNGFALELEEKMPKIFLDDLSPKMRERLFDMLSGEFSQCKNRSVKVGRKKINLPSRDELQKERENMSVAKIAKKYGCSSTTINRRLGLIKKKG